MEFHTMVPLKQPQEQKNKLSKFEKRVNHSLEILSFSERVTSNKLVIILTFKNNSKFFHRKIEVTHSEDSNLRSQSSKKVTGMKNDY